MTPINTVADPPADEDRLRVKQAAQEAKCSGGMIYVWMSENRFKSWTVKRRGFERGIRYIDAKSFRTWLKLQREGVSA
jgi:hypothetical protein